jgi:PPOX class probable F420-dependent enzyme
MRRQAAQARVARVGTVDEHGRVHIVPVTFAIDGDTWYSPSDAGPRPAHRLRHLSRDPRVTILIDVYDEDWARVWWVRLRGQGRVAEQPAEHDRARQLLHQKYPQFASAPSSEGTGPIMAVEITDWTGWAYT